MPEQLAGTISRLTRADHHRRSCRARGAASIERQPSLPRPPTGFATSAYRRHGPNRRLSGRARRHHRQLPARRHQCGSFSNSRAAGPRLARCCQLPGIRRRSDSGRFPGQAYADLVKSVLDTVDQFVKGRVSDADGRDWLAATYPNYFDGGAGGLRLRSGFNRSEAIQRLRLLPLEHSAPGARSGTD
jgi:hypothetical protein